MNSLKSFTIPTVGAVAPADAERAVAVLTLAFSADPVTRWTYPEPAQYLALFPVLVRIRRWRFHRTDRASRRELCRGSALASAR